MLSTPKIFQPSFRGIACLALCCLFVATVFPVQAKGDDRSPVKYEDQAVTALFLTLANAITDGPLGTWFIIHHDLNEAYFVHPRPRVITCRWPTISIQFSSSPEIAVFQVPPPDNSTWSAVPRGFWDTDDAGVLFPVLCAYVARFIGMREAAMVEAEHHPSFDQRGSDPVK
jgi:hypothetical protein